MSRGSVLSAWASLPVAALLLPGCAAPEGAESATEPSRAWPSAHEGHAWLGRELIWFRSAGLGHAIDLRADTARRLAALPGAADSWGAPWLLALPGGGLLAIYHVADDRVTIRTYQQATDSWQPVVDVGTEVFRDDPRVGADAQVRILGAVSTAKGPLLFVDSNWHGTRVRGLRLSAAGQLQGIAADGAPSYDGEALVCAVQGQVLLWGYSHITRNSGAVWDETRDAWRALPPHETLDEPRYSFGHCFTGREVLVFGGAFSSAFGYIRGGGFRLSLDGLAVSPLPTEGAPDGRRDFAMCWIGKEAFLWGGTVETGDPEVRYGHVSDGSAFDPRERKWRPLARHPRPGVEYAGLCAWTGEEVILALENAGKLELWAYHPAQDAWRQLRADVGERGG